ncbi:MAG: autotransporter outer membrane beta-barrel domain-containing protein [Hyphomicrobiales bacterium]|nr:MAG: autotransporter outer membrane beta-barrel domain-containing protein [Hyphomicrobiales bacterium]
MRIGSWHVLLRRRNVASAVTLLAMALLAASPPATASQGCASVYVPVSQQTQSATTTYNFGGPFSPGEVVVANFLSTAAATPLSVSIYANGMLVAQGSVAQPGDPLVVSYVVGPSVGMIVISFTASPGALFTANCQQSGGYGASAHGLGAHYSGQRVQAIITNSMGTSRQIDRLMDETPADGSTSGTGTAPGFTADEKRGLDVATGSVSTPRLGLGMSGNGSQSFGPPLGLRSTYDDDLTSPMRTRGPGSDTSHSGGFTIAGLNVVGADGNSVNFSTSLRDIARDAQQREDQRLAQDPAANAMGFTAARGRTLDRRTNPLDVWVEGRFMRLNDGRNGTDASGHSALIGTGVDYVFSRSLLAGVSLSFDSSGQRYSAQSTEARGIGWLVGPYSTIRLSEHLFWQSRAAWGRASNEVSPNLALTDSFGSTRWLALSKLTGRFQFGPWQLRPSAGVAYMEETAESYVSGTGANVASIKTRVGTASAGPEITYQYRLNANVLIEPRAGLDAIWTFARDVSIGGNSALIGGEAVGPEGVRGRAEIGVRAMIVGGTVLDLSGAYDGIGAGDYNTITGRAVVRMPLN